MRERRPFTADTAEGREQLAEYRNMIDRLAAARALHPGCTRFNGAFEPLDGSEQLEVEQRERELALL